MMEEFNEQGLDLVKYMKCFWQFYQKPKPGVSAFENNKYYGCNSVGYYQFVCHTWMRSAGYNAFKGTEGVTELAILDVGALDSVSPSVYNMEIVSKMPSDMASKLNFGKYAALPVEEKFRIFDSEYKKMAGGK